VIARGARGPGSVNPLLLIAIVLLVFYFLTGSLQSPIQNAARDPIAFIAFLIAIVLGITVHEFMHAYAAHRLGDDTGRLMGRMTLNPLAHFDLFGTLLLVVAGFGYGKPVPFNESRLRSTMSVALVALAGPAANFAIAALCALPLRFCSSAAGSCSRSCSARPRRSRTCSSERGSSDARSRAPDAPRRGRRSRSGCSSC
jgi:hypothetical protein